MSDGNIDHKWEVELGGAFCNPSISMQAKMCNSEGQEIVCKCGKPVSQWIAGADSYYAACSECMNS